MELQIRGLKVDMGEGSRGGKVIGHTSSGKPIYQNADHSSHSKFTLKDHKEAAGFHEEKRKFWIERAILHKSGKSADFARVESAKHNRQKALHIAKITGLKVDAGEGSKGGHVVGHTTSGKPIYQDFKHISHRGFTEKEHHEAHKLQSSIAYHASDARTAVKSMRKSSGTSGDFEEQDKASSKRINQARKASNWHYGRSYEKEYGEPHPHKSFKDYKR